MKKLSQPQTKFKFALTLVTLVTTSLLCDFAHAKVKEGMAFPALQLKSMKDDKPFDLTKSKGKVIVLDFWASWCEPCKVELPALNKLAKQYSKDLEVVGINLDDNAADAQKFLQAHKVDFMIVKKPTDNKVFNPSDEISAMPSSFILDRAGVVRAVHKGFRDGDLQKFEKEIKELINKK